MEEKIPVIAVVGPTASGKTGLAVQTAQKLGGEVVSADSMQIYSELSIGTAKPTEEEMCEVPHHLVGFLSIDEEYSVANYVEDAKREINEIRKRGKIPVICGGTGLYVDSLLTNTEFSEIKSDPKIKERLFAFAEEKGKEALFERLKIIDPETAEKLHYNNLGCRKSSGGLRNNRKNDFRASKTFKDRSFALRRLLYRNEFPRPRGSLSKDRAKN